MTRPLRKTLSYRDQTGAPVEAHTEHWRDFVWEAGPVVVTHEGAPWGKVQVWAASLAEGIRVITHAAAIAGIDVDCADCEWTHQTVANPRYGRTGTMTTRPTRGRGLAVSKRIGPSGPPTLAAPSDE